ncbi:hypothetical protein FQA39_LY03088 [Lamprigera yunnana]|nr:hypothetical protein FQA39_LY03088 [Lamprigera yunnana]
METETNVVQYEEKIKQLLNKLLDAKFVITSDTYLNSLLSHLSGKDNKELGDAILNLPIFTEWLIKSIQYWEDIGILPRQNIISFIVHLVSLLSANEERFIQLNACNGYIRLCTVLKLRSRGTSPSVKLSYIKLLSSFLEHNSGTHWLIATNNWQDVLGYCLENQTTYVLREGYNFIYNTLVKGSECNLLFCNIIVEKIMSIFNELNFINGIVNDESLQKKLTPTLRLILHILLSSLESPSFANRDYRIPSIFLKNCHLEQNICNIIMISSQIEEFFMELNKIMILTHLFGMAMNTEIQIFQVNHLKKLVGEIYKLIGMNITKGFVVNVCHMCFLLQHYWKLMESRLPNVDFNSEEVQIVFESQILILQVLPLLVCSFKECSVNVSEICQDEFRDQFISKVFKSLCEHTIRLAYNYRTLLVTEKVNLFDTSILAAGYVMRSRPYYHRKRAVIVFQYFMYCINDVVNATSSKPQMLQIFSSRIPYFISIFDVITTFIEEFDITWRESVETICVTKLAMDFINLTCWAPRLVVRILKLINLSIVRFMSPHMALLVEGSKDSTMAKLGSLLATKLHDQDWDVRDSSLEILHTVSDIALNKYPSFQNMVLEYEFPSLALTMAMHDNECYVQASAIKCLQKMIKVPRFWNSILKQQDLPTKMIQMIYTETEANVRCEAACLLGQLYEHRSFSPTVIHQINQAMVYAAMTDLDWEVRESALNYWSKVISNHLTNQGMIDGTFPTVTFSKEKRKIVTLTEKEIRSRLNTVLDDLSKCGCLSVLIDAMQDNCDIQVLKKAVDITKTLSKFLKTYDMISNKTETPSSSIKPVLETHNVVGNLTKYSDKVVDDIVKSQDIEYLINNMTNIQEVYPVNGLTSKQDVSPKDFLIFLQRDLDKLVIERTDWLNQLHDFGSLLDDILKRYNSDINAMDCY